MNVVPAALFLMDFSGGGSEQLEELLDDPVAAVEVADIVPFATDPVDEAYVRGVEDGKAAVEADIVARLAEQQTMFERGLAASRESWRREQGTRLAEQLRTATGDLEKRIADATERVLRPLLDEAIRVQAMGELRAILHELVSKTPGVALEVSGPEDLLAAVRESLDGSGAAVSYTTNEACDVQVKAGASILETRIAAWLGQIEGLRL